MTTQLFAEIESLAPKLPGWADVEKAQTLAAAVIALRPHCSVEIGVFGGRSFFPLALAHRAVNRGVVWGIDPWSREAGVECQTTPQDREWWGNLDYDGLYSDFLDRMRELKLGEWCRIYRQRSRTVLPPPGIGLLHIDGAHNDEAIADVERYARNVVSGGLVIMDDLQWTGGGVQRAAQMLARMGFRELYKLGTGAVFQAA